MTRKEVLRREAIQDLLDRIEKLEAVAEAARDAVAWWREYAGSVPAIASIYDLEQALAALEKENDERRDPETA